MTPFQANIVIGLLVLNFVGWIVAIVILHDALHTLILQGNQRREWRRPGEGKHD